MFGHKSKAAVEEYNHHISTELKTLKEAVIVACRAYLTFPYFGYIKHGIDGKERVSKLMNNLLDNKSQENDLFYLVKEILINPRIHGRWNPHSFKTFLAWAVIAYQRSALDDFKSIQMVMNGECNNKHYKAGKEMNYICGTNFLDLLYTKLMENKHYSEQKPLTSKLVDYLCGLKFLNYTDRSSCFLSVK